MKHLITFLIFLFSIFTYSQENYNPYPVKGIELFLNELKDQTSIPFSYYEKESFSIQVTVDSLDNVKLTSLDPYTSTFYKEIKKYVESTEWISGMINGKKNTQTISIPVKLDKARIANMQKAYPKEGLTAFYESFVKYIFTTYYRNFKYSSYKVVFEVDEEGKININEIKPADGAFKFEVTRFLERKTELWTPAKIDGKPIKSRFTLPVKFQTNNN